MATCPVFLPRKSHGQRRLAGYSLWGRRDLDLVTKQQQQTITETSNTVPGQTKIKVDQSMFVRPERQQMEEKVSLMKREQKVKKK